VVVGREKNEDAIGSFGILSRAHDPRFGNHSPAGMPNRFEELLIERYPEDYCAVGIAHGGFEIDPLRPSVPAPHNKHCTVKAYADSVKIVGVRVGLRPSPRNVLMQRPGTCFQALRSSPATHEF
jgi:hypothetical protein